EWAHLRAFGKAIAHSQCLGVVGERLAEIANDRAVHEEARGRDAYLAGVPELRRSSRLHGERDVSVLAHDHRRVAAELHRDALHVLAGESGELLADRN